MKSYLFCFAIVASFCFVHSEDLVWYSQGAYAHTLAWRGSTSGTPASALFESAIQKPWNLVISKSNNIIYWTDSNGVIGKWNITSNASAVVYQVDVGSWSESSKGPALSGIELDDLNNHLYFSFNRSIFKLDLLQSPTSPQLIGSYNNLVFNPRFSRSRNSLYFCLRNSFNDQGDLVQVSLSDPTTVTTLVYNTSTGSIVQQMSLDESNSILYYNSPGTLKILGVSLDPPFRQMFSSIYLGMNPTYMDFNPSTNNFVFGDLRFTSTYVWSPSPNQPTKIYDARSALGVKFYNDTHVIVAYNYIPATSVVQGGLVLVDIARQTSSVIAHNYNIGTSLFLDEKFCDYYWSWSPKSTVSYLDQIIYKKHVSAVYPTEIQKVHSNFGGIYSIAFDVNKRNLIVNRAPPTSFRTQTLTYFPIDQPSALPVAFMNSNGRQVLNKYALHEKTGDIFFVGWTVDQNGYELFRLEASDIQTNPIRNYGRLLSQPITMSATLPPPIAIDSVHDLLFSVNFYSGTAQIIRANLDGTDQHIIASFKNSYRVSSMRVDPTTKRLFLLGDPDHYWSLVSMNIDGTNITMTNFNMKSGSGNDIFSAVNPDPYSDWVYLNADFYQPMRVKKDGSFIEQLYYYRTMTGDIWNLAFDETSGNIYYTGGQASIRQININRISKEDPVATPFEITWQGDSSTYSIKSFILDKRTQSFWIFASNTSYPYNTFNYTLFVTPVNGGQTKQIMYLPKDANSPWAIDTQNSKLYSYSYNYDKWYNPQNQALVSMNLYNGSSLRTLKRFEYPNYSQVQLSTMVLDPASGLLYYTLEGFSERDGTVLESFDTKTFISQRLLKFPSKLSTRNMKLNGTLLYLTASYLPYIYTVDINTLSVQVFNYSASSLALDPTSNNIYLAGGVIAAADARDINNTVTNLLMSLTPQNFVCDFENKKAYFTDYKSSGVLQKVTYYRSDLDGTNKRKLRIQDPNAPQVPIQDLGLFSGQLYTSTGSLNKFNYDGTGFQRILQQIYVSASSMVYDDASQRVYWLESSYFVTCAVYTTFGDCDYLILPSVGQYGSTMSDFVLGKNGMVYFIATPTIYSLDMNVGLSSLKPIVQDSRLANPSQIVINKSKQTLFIYSSYKIFSVNVDGTGLQVLYSNLTYVSNLAVMDLTHCQN